MKDLASKLNMVLVKDCIGMAIGVLCAQSAVDDTQKCAGTTRIVLSEDKEDISKRNPEEVLCWTKERKQSIILRMKL